MRGLVMFFSLMIVAVSMLGSVIVDDWVPQTSEVDPVIERELRNAWMRVSQEIDPTRSDKERIDQSIEELVILFSTESVLVNAVFLVPRLDMSDAESRQFMFFLSMVGANLMPDNRTICRLFAPYWPPEDEGLRNILEGELLGRVVTAPDQPDDFGIDFTVMLDLLGEAWHAGEQQYDGLVDFMYGVNPIMAWRSMLELEGASEEAVDDRFVGLLVFAEPYNLYYRTRPERLPPGTREGLHALLVEYSQDHSLWARVFVAEILNKVPYLRDPEIEETLRADPHWLIQRRLGYLDEEAPDAEQE